jgi:hypothetical protein
MITLRLQHSSRDSHKRRHCAKRLHWAMLFSCLCGLLGVGPVAAEVTPTAGAEKNAPAKRAIQATCDAVGSEVASKGQFVCQYVCRDKYHTKLALVYSNSGSGRCRSPISAQINQTLDSP